MDSNIMKLKFDLVFEKIIKGTQAKKEIEIGDKFIDENQIIFENSEIKIAQRNQLTPPVILKNDLIVFEYNDKIIDIRKYNVENKEYYVSMGSENNLDDPKTIMIYELKSKNYESEFRNFLKELFGEI